MLETELSKLQRYKTAEQRRFFGCSEKPEVTRYFVKAPDTEVVRLKADAETSTKVCHRLQNKLLAISAIYSRWLAEGKSVEDADNALLAVGDVLNSFEVKNDI